MPITAAPMEAIAVLGLFAYIVTWKILSMPPGFVLSGIPVYYLTQTTEYGGHSRAMCKFYLLKQSQMLMYIFVVAWIHSVIDRLRGRSHTTEGWEAVAAEETVELNHPQ